MTKKTNSYVLRLGFTTLWKNKCLNKQTLSNNLTLEQTFRRLLIFNNFEVLRIYYQLTVIKILYYSNFEFTSDVFFFRKYRKLTLWRVFVENMQKTVSLFHFWKAKRFILNGFQYRILILRYVSIFLFVFQNQMLNNFPLLLINAPLFLIGELKSFLFSSKSNFFLFLPSRQKKVKACYFEKLKGLQRKQRRDAIFQRFVNFEKLLLTFQLTNTISKFFMRQFFTKTKYFLMNGKLKMLACEPYYCKKGFSLYFGTVMQIRLVVYFKFLLIQLKIFFWFFKFKNTKGALIFQCNQLKQQSKKLNYQNYCLAIKNIIQVKLLKLFLEMTTLLYHYKSTKVLCDNILFSFFMLIRTNKVHRIFQKKQQAYLYLVLILGITYRLGNIIVKTIAKQILSNKKHFSVLKLFIRTIENLWRLRKYKLKGLQLRLSGKLGGRMRKSKFHYQLGSLLLQSISTRVIFEIDLSYTKFGIISIKLWLIY